MVWVHAWREAVDLDIIAERIEKAALAAQDSSHDTPMVDPKQNVDIRTGTSADQLRLALNTIETELQNPDGLVITDDDVKAAAEAITELRKLVDKIETKLAGYAAEHQERPRSDR